MVDDDFIRHWIDKRRPSLTLKWVEQKQAELSDDTNAWNVEFQALTDTQQIDLIMTRYWLRTLVWQMALHKFILSSDDQTSIHDFKSLAFPIRLSHQLRDFLSAKPGEAVELYLTTYVNLCWVIGKLLSAGILKGLLTMEGQWPYRISFAVQWVWPIPIFIVCYFASESPWWLVRHGEINAAGTALLKLTSKKNTSFNVEETLAMMIHTNELEIQQSAGTSYLDCFKGTDLRRTEVTVMIWVIQQTSGSAMIGWEHIL